ncbi:hypothetical protein BDQ17DRAFT_800956 [Cyathus striatus]|nr:hypothetical protein BDQ17DRAFT_800956 [Cyathus striatus]
MDTQETNKEHNMWWHKEQEPEESGPEEHPIIKLIRESYERRYEINLEPPETLLEAPPHPSKPPYDFFTDKQRLAEVAATVASFPEADRRRYRLLRERRKRRQTEAEAAASEAVIEKLLNDVDVPVIDVSRNQSTHVSKLPRTFPRPAPPRLPAPS